MSLEEIVEVLRTLLNIPAQNRTEGIVSQRRESVNKGGIYYCLETFGLTLDVIRNVGEAEAPEHPDFQYYMLLDSVRSLGRSDNLVLTKHLYEYLKSRGLDVRLDVPI